MLRAVLGDSSGEVRAEARACFALFSKKWKAEADQIFGLLDSSIQKSINRELNGVSAVNTSPPSVRRLASVKSTTSNSNINKLKKVPSKNTSIFPSTFFTRAGSLKSNTAPLTFSSTKKKPTTTTRLSSTMPLPKKTAPSKVALNKTTGTVTPTTGYSWVIPVNKRPPSKQTVKPAIQEKKIETTNVEVQDLE